MPSWPERYPGAFLAGHALFKRTVFGVLAVPRLAALGVLAVLIPVGEAVPPVALLGLATAVAGAVAIWGSRKYPGFPPQLPARRRWLSPATAVSSLSTSEASL